MLIEKYAKKLARHMTFPADVADNGWPYQTLAAPNHGTAFYLKMAELFINELSEDLK